MTPLAWPTIIVRTGENGQVTRQDNEERAENAPAQAVRDQLVKILRSSVFSDSQRMARFLRFAVEETLNGNASRLKEIVIGTEVFDRHAAYDPRLDPIVRVEARRLRAELRSYYDSTGELDPVVIELPKGRYSPVFQLRSEIRPPVQAAGPRKTVPLPFFHLLTSTPRRIATTSAMG